MYFTNFLPTKLIKLRKQQTAQNKKDADREFFLPNLSIIKYVNTYAGSSIKLI